MAKRTVPARVASEVKKAHEAVAIAPRSGKITLLTRRFFNVLLQYAQEDGEKDIYRRPLQEIMAGASYESTNMEVLKDTLRRMSQVVVEWNSVTDAGNRRWGVSALLAGAEIVEEGRRLHVEWSYSPQIRARLLDPEMYVRLSLRMYSSLRSVTSAALYEICMRYVTNAGGLTNRAAWQWWRPRLTGVPDDAEEQPIEYKYFKRDVLRPAINEVNRITDITVELIEYKDGRRVGDIQFSASKKSQQGLALEDHNLVDNGLLERIVRLGFTKEEAAKLYTGHEENLVRMTVEFVEGRLVKRGMKPIDSPAALFRDALKKGYGKVEVQRVRALPVSKVVPTPKPEQPPVAPDPKIVEARRNALENFRAKPERDQAAILNEFAKANPALRSSIKRNPEGKGVQTALAGWLLSQSRD